MPKSPKTSQNRLAYGVAELARALGIHRTTVWRMIRRQQIQSVRVGDRVMIPAAELQRLKLIEM